MSGRRGAALPAAMLAVLGFSVVVAGTYALLRIQVRETVYQVRAAQAQAVAEAGLEDAMFTIMQSPKWKTGYAAKAFAGGYYTVSISTDQQPWITSTGYSAPIPVMGRAARTVKAQVVFDGFYNYSASSFTANWAVAAYDSTTFGGRTPTCKKTSLNSNGCQFGAYVFANTAVITSGGGLINGDATYATATSTPPAAATVLGKVILTGSTSTVTSVDGSYFLTNNDNNATRISPFTAYSTTTKVLTVNAASGNVTLSSGTYYFKGISVSSQTLTVSLADATQAVSIYLAGNLFVSPQGAIDSSAPNCNSGGGCRATNVHIYGQGGGLMYLSGFTAVTGGANKTYIDLYCPQDDIVVNQRVLGRLVGKTVQVLNPYGTSGTTYPVFLFDVNFGITPNSGAKWVSGSWSESYYKP